MQKVTDVKTFLVHPGTGKNWLFVKVETDAGIHGWGEAYTQADRDHAIAVHVEQLRRYLIGRDPFQIKHFTTVMYLDFAGKRGAMDFYSALSGLEQALWTLPAKRSPCPSTTCWAAPAATAFGCTPTAGPVATIRPLRRHVRPWRWSSGASPR